MHKYLVKRIIMMLPTLLGAGIFIFFLLRMIPGDVCLVRLRRDRAASSIQAAIEARLACSNRARTSRCSSSS